MQHPLANVEEERQHTKCHAEDVNNIVAVVQDLARAATIRAALAIDLYSTGEGLRHERTLEQRLVELARGRVADGGGEVVDHLKHKDSRECAAQVGYTLEIVSHLRL